jgi:hypothetical protein
MGACGGQCVRRSVRLYEEIIYQTHVIIDPIAFGGIDHAQLRTIHGNFYARRLCAHHITEIRDLLLTLFGNQKTRQNENRVREA